MSKSNLPMPVTINEARFEAMGIILGIVDLPRIIQPKADLPASVAIQQYSEMVERMASDHYGDDWKRFVALIRGNVQRQN